LPRHQGAQLALRERDDSDHLTWSKPSLGADVYCCTHIETQDVRALKGI
jgi:hypothetical protein